MNNLKDIKQIDPNDSSMTLGEILLDALCDYLNVQENSSIIPSNLFDLEAKIDSILTNELKGGDQVMCFLIVFFPQFNVCLLIVCNVSFALKS